MTLKRFMSSIRLIGEIKDGSRKRRLRNIHKCRGEVKAEDESLLIAENDSERRKE